MNLYPHVFAKLSDDHDLVVRYKSAALRLGRRAVLVAGGKPGEPLQPLLDEYFALSDALDALDDDAPKPKGIARTPKAVARASSATPRAYHRMPPAERAALASTDRRRFDELRAENQKAIERAHLSLAQAKTYADYTASRRELRELMGIAD